MQQVISCNEVADKAISKPKSVKTPKGLEFHRN